MKKIGIGLLFTFSCVFAAKNDFSEIRRSNQHDFAVYGHETSSVKQVYTQLKVMQGFFENFLSLEVENEHKLEPTEKEVFLYGREGQDAPAFNYTLQLLENLGTRQARLNIHLSEGLNPEKLNRGLLKLLLLGKYYKLQPEREKYQMSEWFSVGLYEVFLKSENKQNHTLYLENRDNNPFFDLQKLQSTSNLETLTIKEQEQFQVAAGALIHMLISETDASFQKLALRMLNFEGDLRSLLGDLYPSMFLSSQGLQKWWLLSAVELGKEPLTGVLGLAETRERTLALIRSDKSLEIQIQDYNTLSTFSFLSYQAPLRRIANAMKSNPENTNLEELVALNHHSKAVTDYLDYFVITNFHGKSKKVEQLLNDSAKRKKLLPKRNDWLRKTLDDAQKAYLNDNPIEILTFEN